MEITEVTFDDNKYLEAEDNGGKDPLAFENADYLEELENEEESHPNEEQENNEKNCCSLKN